MPTLASAFFISKMPSRLTTTRTHRPHVLILHLALCVFFHIALTAQIPYEYFDIHTITPPEAAASSLALPSQARQSGVLHLDSETHTAGDLSLNDPFLPAVGIYQRQTVFSEIHRSPSSAARFSLTAQAHDMALCKTYIPTTPTIPDAIYRTARLTIDATVNPQAYLPGDSSEMQLTQIQALDTDSGQKQAVQIYRCANDLYSILFPRPGIYEVTYDTASYPDTLPPKDAAFFKGAKKNPLPLTHEQSEEISSLIHATPALRRIMNASDPLVSLIRYFQSFQSESLESSLHAGETLEALILKEEKGLCRHRAVLFLILSRYMGYKTRVVGNSVHAFVEIHHRGRWYPTELGGQARSLTIHGWGKNSTVSDDHNFAPSSTSHAPEHPRKAQSDTSAKSNDFEFIRTTPHPDRLLRDRVLVLQGQMFDLFHHPLTQTRFAYELKHPQRESKRISGTTDDQGMIRLELRIPADWPLGESEGRWSRVK